MLTCPLGVRRWGRDRKWVHGVEAAYPVVCERHEALAYPLLCVDVADCDVQCDQDHETQEDGPFYDEALLLWTVSFSVLVLQGGVGGGFAYSCVPVWNYTAVLDDEAIWRSRRLASIFRRWRRLPLYKIGVHLVLVCMCLLCVHVCIFVCVCIMRSTFRCEVDVMGGWMWVLWLNHKRVCK